MVEHLDNDVVEVAVVGVGAGDNDKNDDDSELGHVRPHIHAPAIVVGG